VLSFLVLGYLAASGGGNRVFEAGEVKLGLSALLGHIQEDDCADDYGRNDSSRYFDLAPQGDRNRRSAGGDAHIAAVGYVGKKGCGTFCGTCRVYGVSSTPWLCPCR